MDPLTQGVLGASLPQATRRQNRHVALAGALGFVSGMAADLDVLIRSDIDPLLYLEFHRQFTHSLIFIPVGGLICATLLHALFFRWWQLEFHRTAIFCTLGYATHALLDTATSYGTMLFWPFSDTRFSWSIISIIDPLFTLPMLVLVVMAAVRRRALFARIALVWGALYMSFGVVLHVRALEAAADLAAARGHQTERLEVKPSFGNLLVWKSVYATSDRYYVDAVRVGLSPSVYPGESVPKLNTSRQFPWVHRNSQQYADIERFAWFSQGFVAPHPTDPTRIIDVRYSMVPNSLDALWSIKLTNGAPPEAHVAYHTHRGDVSASQAVLWKMILGEAVP